jgi:hypothetical protein
MYLSLYMKRSNVNANGFRLKHRNILITTLENPHFENKATDVWYGISMYVHGNYYLFFFIANVVAAPTRHFVVLSKVWFLIQNI